MLSPINLLVISFVIKIFSRKPIFTYIREQHGNETFRRCRGLEKDTIRYEKLCSDLRFLLVCKKEGLVPTFAKPKLSINGSVKLQKEIAVLIIKTELKNKHRLKNQLKEELRRCNQAIRGCTSFLLFHALRYQIRSVIDTKRKKWESVHQRKLLALREANTLKRKPDAPRIRPGIIHNFSSYVLSDREVEVLSYSLDHYVPGRENGKRTQVEFERFFQEILPYTMHLPAEEKDDLKLKFLRTYNKYSKVKVPNEDKEVLERLYKNKEILILRQDKGRGVVLMNKVDYLNKSKAFLDGVEFERLDTDPTKSFQTKVQDTLRDMKKKFTKKEYKRLYPSSSRPGLFFGLAKVHKLKDDNKNVEELPLRPVISNIGTATYDVSKYLAALLQPIAKSNFTIESSKDFVEKIRSKKIKEEYEMVSFDVVSLFTSVPLDLTIEIILRKVYDEKLIQTKLKKDEMKKLLELCTKEMHFSFDDKIFRQINGVAMGSPLGPVIANIFMVELEERLMPTMGDMVDLWFRYVDDTFTFIKKGEIDRVLQILNSFHEGIKFTFEKESNNSIAFLDVKVLKKTDGSFDTDIHRKKTDTNVYLNWNSFAPKSWKVGTLKGLIRRSFVICSTEEYRTREIEFLRKVFRQNSFPSRIINSAVHEVRTKMLTDIPQGQETTAATDESSSPTATEITEPQSKEPIYTPFICLPYKGKQGEQILKPFRNTLRESLPRNVQPRIIFKGKKLGSYFRIKDKVPVEHESNLVYAFKPEAENVPDYVGETKVRMGTRVYEHINTDKASSVYKHKVNNNLEISEDDFEIIDRGFPKTLDRKLAEAIYVKELDPVLNRQKATYKLLLFN